MDTNSTFGKHLLISRQVVVMLKYRKNFILILLYKVSIPVSILVPYNITIQEISDKLKKFFEISVRNILETLTYKFLKYFDKISRNLRENFEATSKIGT